jgi:hypothetical protein
MLSDIRSDKYADKTCKNRWLKIKQDHKLQSEDEYKRQRNSGTRARAVQE